MNRRKAVLITGGARRVGAVITEQFAANGYDIALHYGNSKAEAEALKHEIEKRNVRCHLLAHDLSDVQSMPRLLAEVRAAFPHCDALINNASVFERGEFMETDEALFDRQFAINFKAPFFLTQGFAKTFGRGAVVNVLDTHVEKNVGSHFAYLLSKKALAEFTRMSARALGPQIRVNGICPGIMLPSNELDEPYMQRLERELPLKKLATPEHVADVALWLCESQNVTGQLIFADGGECLL